MIAQKVACLLLSKSQISKAKLKMENEEHYCFIHTKPFVGRVRYEPSGIPLIIMNRSYRTLEYISALCTIFTINRDISRTILLIHTFSNEKCTLIKHFFSLIGNSSSSVKSSREKFINWFCFKLTIPGCV